MAVSDLDVQAARAAPVLVDVREPDEWALGHAPGAIHVPLSAFDASAIPSGGPVAVICRSGGRSARAAEALDQQGYDVANVVGGMLEWQAQGLPVVIAGGEPGIVPA